MPKITPMINNLAAGELDPELICRTDIAQYSAGAQTLENFITMALGGAHNTPGTLFIAETKYSDKESWLIDFEFSDEQAYAIEMGDKYLRFYKDGGQIVKSSASAWVTSTGYVVGDYVTKTAVMYYCVTAHTSGTFSTDLAAGKWIAQTIYERPTSYLEADVKLVKYTQTFDTMYLTHKTYPQAKLTRTAHDAWTFTNIDFSVGTARPALMKENATATTITPSAATGTGITLTASTSIFVSTHVNSIWKVNAAYVKIKTFSSGTSVTADVLYSGNIGGTTAYTKWQEAAWSDYRGYPRACALYEQRLIYASTDNQPQTIWISESGVYDNFELGTDDTDPMEYTISADQACIIKWLTSGKVLGVGTTNGVFNLSSGSATAPLTATTQPQVTRETVYGVADMSPESVASAFFYLQRNGRTLRQFFYNFQDDSYKSADVSIFSKHITKGSLVDCAYQQSPRNILWFVRGDGEIVTVMIEEDQKVSSWHRQWTNGKYESVCTNPNGEEDIVYVQVQRDINGTSKRYIEHFAPFDAGDYQDKEFFVHCGVTVDVSKDITGVTQANPAVVTCVAHGYSNGDTVYFNEIEGMTELNGRKYEIANKTNDTFELTECDATVFSEYESGGLARKCFQTVTGLTHLEGEEVSVLGDGADAGLYTVNSGSITLDTLYGIVHVGIPIASVYKSMPLEGGSYYGTAQDKIKRITKAHVRFYKTLGASMGTEDNPDPINFYEPGQYTDIAPPLFSGYKKIQYPQGWNKECVIYITQTAPLPIRIIGIIPEFETTE